MTTLHATILLPFIFAVLVPVLYRWMKHIHTGWAVLAVPAALFIYLLQYIPEMVAHETIQSTLHWIPSLGIDFTVQLDGLGLLFALLITGIGSLVILYSIFYLSKVKEDLGSFYVYLLLFMGAMLGVVLSDNLIVLYGFWELTSLSSFLLIGYWYKRERSKYGAQKSLLITVFGGLAMLAGFILIYLMAGTFSIREIIQQAPLLSGESLFLPAMLLILLGAFTKSAQFPFHIWLPDAMEAPTPVSAYLHSATMVKAGLYLVARLSPLFAGQAEWFWLVGGFGLVTLFWGSFSALRQTDLKAILAYSTVSQLGLIMTLFGIGSAAAYFDIAEEAAVYSKAIAAAVFHLINHATFKGALFMAVGIVDHQTGTRDIRKLGGLAAIMPITFTITMIGGFSMAGLPPFNGFLSKEMFFTSVLLMTNLEIFNAAAWGTLFPVIAWTASVLTFAYSMMIVFKTFTGSHRPDQLEKPAREASLGLLVSPLVLVSLVILFGLYPNLVSYALIEPAMAAIQPNVLAEGQQFAVDIRFWHGFTTELYMTIGVIVVGISLFLILWFIKIWLKTHRNRFSLNRAYDGLISGMETVSNRINRWHMTGFVRDYLVYIFTFIVLVLGTALFSQNAVHFDFSGASPVYTYELLVAIGMVTAASVVLFTTSRLTAIISVGVVGYLIALFFVLFRAPDLALTQLTIETVSVALFLLCFYHLPQLKKELTRVRFRLTNMLISIGVGLVITLIALSVQGISVFESISQYFVEHSYSEAGGKNIVNVILVDFRGFDTLFEILVLGISALGVYALIKLRLTGRDEL